MIPLFFRLWLHMLILMLEYLAVLLHFWEHLSPGNTWIDPQIERYHQSPLALRTIDVMYMAKHMKVMLDSLALGIQLWMSPFP